MKSEDDDETTVVSDNKRKKVFGPNTHSKGHNLMKTEAEVETAIAEEGDEEEDICLSPDFNCG